jgi:hypothetical protein
VSNKGNPADRFAPADFVVGRIISNSSNNRGHKDEVVERKLEKNNWLYMGRILLMC